tara:strand:- start:1474 stop:2373 length:900 start_codon:yes stop_codon:yes gene_type:complete
MKKHSDEMPQIGFGTYLIADNEVESIVTTAIKVGYRHIDTAEGYGNEAGIGNALKNAHINFNLKREDIFVTTKLFPGNPQWGRDAKNYSDCISACDNSLSRLGLEYLDCYLIHAPFCVDHRLEQWKALVDLKKAGKLKSIGVSNYSEKHIQEIISAGLEVPEVNQIELHPWCQKINLVSFLKQKSIKIVAYSSLVPLESWRGKPNQGSAKSEEMKQDGADKNSFSKELAQKYGVTEAQILLKWGLQKGFVILPKSTDEVRIKENFSLSFDIDKPDMNLIEKIDRGDGVAWPGGDPCNAV